MTPRLLPEPDGLYAYLSYAFAVGARRSDFVVSGPPEVDRDAAETLARLIPRSEPPVPGDALDTLYRVLSELTIHDWDAAIRLLVAVGRPRREDVLSGIAAAISRRVSSLSIAPPSNSALALLERRRRELPSRSTLRESAPQGMSRDASGHPQQRAVRAKEVKPRSVSAILHELDRLPGLNGVRAQVRAILARQELKKAREKIGLPVTRPDLHTLLIGPPGTGKTMTARLLAELYAACGMVRRPRFVEASRQTLVGQYVGQSAPRTAEAVSAALGGVLFIDEAYSLAGDSYSDEAIAELVRLMENHRDDLVVVFAGYPTMMTDFLQQNPGLASRVGLVLEFESFGIDDLLEILDLQALEAGYLLSEDAVAMATEWFTAHRHDRAFGNGRAARQLLDLTMTNHALRVNLGRVDDDELVVLTAADIPPARVGGTRAAGNLGYL